MQIEFYNSVAGITVIRRRVLKILCSIALFIALAAGLSQGAVVSGDTRPHRLRGVTVPFRDAEENVLTQQDINVIEHLDWWTFRYLYSDLIKVPELPDWWTFHLSDETAATLEIRPVQVRGMEAGRYLFDAPIPIQLEISNKTAGKIDVTLNEHYRDGRPHRLWGIKVCVRDGEGKVLTQNDRSRPELRDWWTFGYLNSDTDACTIGVDCHLSDDIDTVTLVPGEKVQRIVNLDWFLLGAPLLHGPLPPGRYSLEVKLNKMTSNSLEIRVDAAEKDASSE